MEEDKYLVWSNQHSAWWNPKSMGYTRHVERAGRFSREEAIDIARGAHDGWRKGEVPPEIAVAERDVLEIQAPHPSR